MVTKTVPSTSLSTVGDGVLDVPFKKRNGNGETGRRGRRKQFSYDFSRIRKMAARELRARR